MICKIVPPLTWTIYKPIDVDRPRARPFATDAVLKGHERARPAADRRYVSKDRVVEICDPYLAVLRWLSTSTSVVIRYDKKLDDNSIWLV